MAENTIYLTFDRARRSEKMGCAVISRGQPQLGDRNVVVLAVERCRNMKEARAWFRRMKDERPWETRQ